VPLTLPTHPLAVVPLKLWRPRWFDGVGLVLGAIAPDLAYVADGYTVGGNDVTIHGHAWHAPVWWAVPLTLVLAPLVRWAAAPVAAHLPRGGPLALHDYGALSAVKHRWWVTAWSAALGAVSHILWDAVTHPAVDGGHVPFPWLLTEAMPGWPWWLVVSRISDLVGFVVATLFVVHIGRSGLLRRWHGAPVPVRRRPVRFWTVAAVVTVAGMALLPLQPVRLFHDQAVRALLVVSLALLAGALASSPNHRARLPVH
jgi:hypothetical protein